MWSLKFGVLENVYIFRKMFTRVNILRIIFWARNVYIFEKNVYTCKHFFSKINFWKMFTFSKKCLHLSIFLRKNFEMKKCLHFSKNVYKCKHFSRNVNIWKSGFKAILAVAKNVYTREKMFTRVNILSNLKSRWKMFTVFTVFPPPQWRFKYDDIVGLNNPEIRPKCEISEFIQIFLK